MPYELNARNSGFQKLKLPDGAAMHDFTVVFGEHTAAQPRSATDRTRVPWRAHDCRGEPDWRDGRGTGWRYARLPCGARHWISCASAYEGFLQQRE